jgi:hypothetical protein
MAATAQQRITIVTAQPPSYEETVCEIKAGEPLLGKWLLRREELYYSPGLFTVTRQHGRRRALDRTYELCDPTIGVFICMTLWTNSNIGSIVRSYLDAGRWELTLSWPTDDQNELRIRLRALRGHYWPGDSSNFAPYKSHIRDRDGRVGVDVHLPRHPLPYVGAKQTLEMVARLSGGLQIPEMLRRLQKEEHRSSTP